jgi:hypothetical protein
VRPVAPFPAEPIKAVAGLERDDVLKKYLADAGSIDLMILTPPVAGWRAARARAVLEAERAAARGEAPVRGSPAIMIDPIEQWRDWDSALRERWAVVMINAVPDRTPFLFHKRGEVLDFRNGNVSSITLLRDGIAVEPIETAYFPAVANVADHTAKSKPVFQQGIALYRPREFAPLPTGGMSRYEVAVTVAERPDRPVRISLSAAMIQTIINDFAPYGLQR